MFLRKQSQWEHPPIGRKPLRVRVRTAQIASTIMCAHVQVRVLPLVAKVIQFRLRRSSNQCTLKKKLPKRNIVR